MEINQHQTNRSIENHFLMAKKYKFDFDSLNNAGDSILSILLKKNSSDFENLIVKTIGISHKASIEENNWLYLLLRETSFDNKKYQRSHRIILKLLSNNRLETNILNVIFSIYTGMLYLDNLYNKIYGFIKEFIGTDRKFTKYCLKNKDDRGNTIIHKLAKIRDKKSLSFIKNEYRKLKIGANNAGKFPADLYKENKLEKYLESIQS